MYPSIILAGILAALFAPKAEVSGSGNLDWSDPDSRRRVVWVVTGGCEAHCTCSAGLTPITHNLDTCIATKIVGIVSSQSGCCGEQELPTCLAAPDGCIMGSITYQFKLVGGNCSCTSIDIGTSGADAGQSQGGLGTGVLSQPFTVGGFGLFCDSLPDGNGASGYLTITCTAGGMPTPRTMASLEFQYSCAPCGG